MVDETTTDRPDIGTSDDAPTAEPAAEDTSPEELDFSDLEDQCAEAMPDDMPTGRKAAMSRSAKAFFRTRVIDTQPDLQLVAQYLDQCSESEVLNIDGIGKTGYQALTDVLLPLDDEPAQTVDSNDGEIKQVEESSDTGVRVINQNNRVEIEHGDGDPDEASAIRPVSERRSVQRAKQRDESDSTIQPVRRRYRTPINAPTCDACGSDMRTNGTHGNIRHFACMNDDCDNTAQKTR